MEKIKPIIKIKINIAEMPIISMLKPNKPDITERISPVISTKTSPCIEFFRSIALISMLIAIMQATRKNTMKKKTPSCIETRFLRFAPNTSKRFSNDTLVASNVKLLNVSGSNSFIIKIITNVPPIIGAIPAKNKPIF